VIYYIIDHITIIHIFIIYYLLLMMYYYYSYLFIYYLLISFNIEFGNSFFSGSMSPKS
jgi:hypothetical protein